MKTSRQKMINFLKNHFRYWTANPWNKATSYAQNIKIYNWVPEELQEKAYDLLTIEEVFDEIDNELSKFGDKYNWKYQIYFNGRSNGYLVLYQGGITEEGKIWVKPGLGMDENETFEDWDYEFLKERYNLVREFDKTVEKAKKIFLNYCKNFDIEEKEELIPVRVKTLKPKIQGN